MQDDRKLAEESYLLIRKDFEIEADVLASDDPFDLLFDMLDKSVKQMLDQDFNNLLNVLYRIDVAETKVKEILNQTEPDLISKELTQLIIDRQKQKAIYRAIYR